jgi:signal transduction histidine kinase
VNQPAEAVRILHLEDDLNDAELVALRVRADLPMAQITVVGSKPAFERALATMNFDIVLSDYSLPGFTGLAAAEMLRATRSDLPFILVTGTIGDDGASAALRAGVTDYVLKDRLERLGPAIRRALEEVRVRRREAELEEQLRQAQKMEAVGQLTGGIAHDFNNILTIIMASAELVQMGLTPQQKDLHQDLEALLQAGDRGKEMIRKLLGFSRRQPLEPQALDVALLIEGIADTLKRLLPASIVVERDVAPDVPPMLADAGSVEQILLNLATNARDAMPSGGVLHLTATLAREDDLVLRRRGASGRFVRIDARDTGSGMPPEVVARVFEPFYTTKPEGKGTGLGMAMIYGLAKQQLGFVEVASEVGRGTTVSLYLPVATAAPVSETAAPRGRRSGENRPSTGGLVLIADDEAVLRRVMERALTRAGYRVVCADSGMQALQQIRELHQELVLVITDQMMPGFGGADLYREARKLGITVPFLVTSGYSLEQLAEKGFGLEVKRLIKPWTVDELTAAVKAALEDG